MTHRFLKAAPAVYESLRAQIDSAWGFPTLHTQTSMPPAADQNKHADGDCIMAVRVSWLAWEPVATLIPQAIEDGLIAEMSEAEYWASVAKPEPFLP
jgi:hypothetical protein